MVAAASDAVQPELIWLHRLVDSHPPVIERIPDHRCGGGNHSRTRDGRIVCWRPPVTVGVAVDAEVADQEVPGLLSRRWHSRDPETVWRWWTATEVTAKLAHVPILAWISTQPPVTANPCPTERGDVWWCTQEMEGLRITFGFLAPQEDMV